METGYVKYYDQKKAFGFIKSSRTGIETFFHLHECCYTDIREGDKVSYVLWDSKNKPGTKLAVEVKKLEDE